MDIEVNYHSSIRIGDIYIDPFNIKEKRGDAKYIFITHSHYDHYSLKDIEKLVGNDTIFVCTSDVEEEIKKSYSNGIIVVEPNKSYFSGNIKFCTIPSYNINKKFHPKSNNWVGYIIEVNNIRYAILGDTDLTEDVKEIKCDVLFVPIGGTYTMSASEASELTNIINPQLVIPVHYNSIVGNKDDEKVFLEGLKKVNYKLFL